MKTTMKDLQGKRTIVKDYDKDTLTISGDYAPSTLTSYAVYNCYSEKIYFISLTRDRAEEMCNYYNKKEFVNSFFVCEKTIFI